MDFDRAKELLRLHSCADPDLLHLKWSGGFVGTLRPYTGLNEDNFHEVMAAIVAVAPHLADECCLDREIVSTLWSLCMTARNWGLHPNGMLQRNGLISEHDIERLDSWVEAIEWAITMLLDRAPDVPLDRILDGALASYRQVTGRDFPPDE